MTPYIVYGGPSSENEVSCASKDLFLELLKVRNPILIEWKKDMSFVVNGEVLSLESLLSYLKEHNGIFVNAMHGEFCEDGWIQEYLEKAGIPFTGPSSESAKQSMDKIRSQDIVKDIIAIIPTESITLTGVDGEKEGFVQKVLSLNWNYPLFVKPNAKGSSVGVYKVNNEEELIKTASELAPDTYLIQPGIEGTEVSIGTVCDNGEFLDLPATEILPKGDFFDYKSKYTEGGSNEITPARVSKEVMDKLKEVSIEIHKRLDLGCYSRTDIIIGKDNNMYYLETNSLPGMSKMSLLPQQLRVIGKLGEFGEILLRNINQVK